MAPIPTDKQALASVRPITPAMLRKIMGEPVDLFLALEKSWAR